MERSEVIAAAGGDWLARAVPTQVLISSGKFSASNDYLTTQLHHGNNDQADIPPRLDESERIWIVTSQYGMDSIRLLRVRRPGACSTELNGSIGSNTLRQMIYVQRINVGMKIQLGGYSAKSHTPRRQWLWANSSPRRKDFIQRSATQPRPVKISNVG